MPGGYVCSATMKARHDATAVRAVHQGTKPIRSIFSKEQRAFFKGHAPDGIELDDLTLLGPIPVMKVRFVPEGFGRKLVAELWHVPRRIQDPRAARRRRCPGEAFQVATEARLFLKANGVDLSGDQQTKTKTALEFFATPPTDS